jgi:hypothetical protein
LLILSQVVRGQRWSLKSWSSLSSRQALGYWVSMGGGVLHIEKCSLMLICIPFSCCL